ncbi:MAG: LysE/ArgO family amino acid transporter [Alphaproteobacteria bacterium]
MPCLSFAPFLEGFFTGAGLIIAIGPQNAFVLKQAIQRNHVLTIAVLCSVIDAFLITLGITSLGELLTTQSTLLTVAKWGGALFLTAYGIKSFYSVFKTQSLVIDGEPERLSLKKTVLMILALSFLNPHVYLDNCILLGSIGAQFPLAERYCFLMGAVLASFVWFFSVCYGARYLRHFFANPLSWKILDFSIGCIMIFIAALLVLG